MFMPEVTAFCYIFGEKCGLVSAPPFNYCFNEPHFTVRSRAEERRRALQPWGRSWGTGTVEGGSRRISNRHHLRADEE